MWRFQKTNKNHYLKLQLPMSHFTREHCTFQLQRLKQWDLCDMMDCPVWPIGLTCVIYWTDMRDLLHWSVWPLGLTSVTSCTDLLDLLDWPAWPIGLTCLTSSTDLWVGRSWTGRWSRRQSSVRCLSCGIGCVPLCFRLTGQCMLLPLYHPHVPGSQVHTQWLQ